ncbi:MAG TPA: SDR family oxidoreductase [Kofleriaceae bacterium]|jgi:NAD(P)-dependent dehydrogenase (short-subunit alcohol dehydrogenase family)|nr:SDR family oxidoreductase [Kofleriaceae bacterium]
MSTSKTILITGATAGIGRTTALHLAGLGHHVIASGRKPGELSRLAAEARGLAGKLDTIPLDVTQPASIAAAVDAVAGLTGERGLDVLINNAGFGVLGPTSEISDAELRRQYETNVFGLMSVTRAFLPGMRTRRAGRIINVSSVGGRITLPYFGVYNSTKYAIESLSDALRYELAPFGIGVVLIEPGVIRTRFEATAATGLDGFAATPYGRALANYERMSRSADRFAAEPIVVARAIARAAAARRPAARYVTPWLNRVALWLSAILPTSVWDWTMRRAGYLTPAGLELSAVPAAAPAAAPPAEPPPARTSAAS